VSRKLVLENTKPYVQGVDFEVLRAGCPIPLHEKYFWLKGSWTVCKPK